MEQEILQWLNGLDLKDREGTLTYEELMREIRGMIIEVEIGIKESA